MEVILIVEDQLAEAVMRKLIEETKRVTVYQSITKGGVGAIKTNLSRFCNACKTIPHVICVDLDRSKCAPRLLSEWGFNSANHPNLLLRVAVRETEAWLLADQKGVAEFLRVPVVKVPAYPESLSDAKRTLINLARRSRSKRLMEELVPANGSSASVGPSYNALLSEFVREKWDMQQAGNQAPSLAKAIARLSTFMRADTSRGG